jgi:glycosyltransferase involved in cell wall biosynthesis
MMDRARLLILNSLDRHHGSTYRIRALQRGLAEHGVPSRYVEGSGSKPLRVVTISLHAFGDYDVLLTQKFNPVTLVAIAIARLRHKPVVVDWDDLDAGLQASLTKRWIATFCEVVGPRMATALTTHSTVIREVAEARGASATIVPQGFDAQLFRPSPELRRAGRSRWRFSADDRVVGYMCTFTSGGAMDLPVVLDAWARIDTASVKFLLIGGGPLRDHVEQEVRRRGLEGRVTFTGLLDQREVPEALAALDAGVVSMSDIPANRARVSLKTIEYLAMEVPVAGILVGETARLFGELVVQPRPGETLGQAILAALADPGKRPPRERISSFAWHEVAATLRDVIAAAGRRARKWT